MPVNQRDLGDTDDHSIGTVDNEPHGAVVVVVSQVVIVVPIVIVPGASWSVLTAWIGAVKQAILVVVGAIVALSRLVTLVEAQPAGAVRMLDASRSVAIQHGSTDAQWAAWDGIGFARVDGPRCGYHGSYDRQRPYVGGQSHFASEVRIMVAPGTPAT